MKKAVFVSSIQSAEGIEQQTSLFCPIIKTRVLFFIIFFNKKEKRADNQFSMRFLSIFILVFLFSCFSPTPPLPSGNEAGIDNEEEYTPPEYKRRVPKRPDPKKQEKCNEKGSRDCEGIEDCEDICDDIFNRRREKQDCYELPEELVLNFEKLIDLAEDGDIEDIDAGVLECLLDIDDREFTNAVKKMSRRESRDFLATVADNDVLAEILEEEDDEFNILKQILSKAAGSSDLQNMLQKEIDDGKTIVWLFGEGNEFSWKWLDGYVDEECDDRNSSSCPSGENIGAYCTALLKMTDRELEDFLHDAGEFAEEYQEDIEDEDFEYEVDADEKDFKDYCNEQQPSPCPADGTEPSTNKLTTITTAGSLYGGSLVGYVINGGYCHNPGNRLRAAAGSSSDTDQNILLHISNYPELHLNNDKINFDSNNKYYIYLDENRYELTDPEESEYEGTCGAGDTVGMDILRWYSGDSDLDRTGLTTSLASGSTVDIYIAKEVNGRCSYFE